MSTDFPNRRRNYYIKKEFQRNFILKFCALVALGALISGAIVYAMSMKTVTTTFENSRLTIKSTADYMLPAVLLSGIVVVAIVGLAAVIMTLLASHRIAGALYAIEKGVDKVTAGNLNTEFHLRSGDEIKALAVGLNVMVASLRKNLNAIRESCAELESAIQKSTGPGAKAEVEDALEKLKADIGKFV